MLLPDMAGSWQEYVATDLDVGGDLDDDESSGGAPMIGLLPGRKFVANTRVTRRYAGSRFTQGSKESVVLCREPRCRAAIRLTSR